ncbi:hypothetical protein ACHAXR_011203 [Thalassiosira sp. AJA248-18]
MNNSPPFSFGVSFDQVLQNEIRYQQSSTCCDEYLSQEADFGIKQGTNAGFDCTSAGRQTSYERCSPCSDKEYPSQAAANPGFDYTPAGRQDQEQVLLNMKLQIAKQQEKVDSLSLKLGRCHGVLGPGDGHLARNTLEPQTTKYNVPGIDFTSTGRQTENQALLNMKLQIADQQEKADLLALKLGRCHGVLGPGYGQREDSALSQVEPQTKYSKKISTAMQKSSKEQFPTKLYEMLELADVQGYGSSSNAVAWLPHGRAFRVLDEQSFMESIVPVFFNQTKIRSFYRQLHLWGFKRLSMGRDAGVWYNGFFVRGSQSEIKKMVRIKVKGKSKSSDPFVNHKEPDFYGMATAHSRSTKPAIEMLNGDSTEVSNKYANEIEYYVKLFLSQPKHDCIGASNMNVQHVDGNEVNLSQMTYQAGTLTHFPIDDTCWHRRVTLDNTVQNDDFDRYIDTVIW